MSPGISRLMIFVNSVDINLFWSSKIVNGPKPRLVVLPFHNRTVIDRLPHLPGAGGLDDSLVPFRRQAGGIPGETAKLDHFAHGWLRVRYKVFVLNIEDSGRRQHAPPMIHQTSIA